MTATPTLADLFVIPPGAPPPLPGVKQRDFWQWGMRGDPYLWHALREHFAGEPLPATEERLDELVAAAFAELTGQPLTTADAFFVQRFAHGGMSSGYVMPAWWRGTALAFLRHQLRALRA
jgi:hypothetical protein